MRETILETYNKGEKLVLQARHQQEGNDDKGAQRTIGLNDNKKEFKGVRKNGNFKEDGTTRSQEKRLLNRSKQSILSRRRKTVRGGTSLILKGTGPRQKKKKRQENQ